MFGFLGLMLGVTAGGLTGVAIKGVISDPVVTGSGAVAFYAAFGISSLMTMFVMLNYVMMTLRISVDGFDVRLGMKSAVVKTDDLVAVRIAVPQSRMTRAAAQARPNMRNIAKMWSVLGVKTGIELDVRVGGDSGKVETWFIASNDSESLNDKLVELIGATDDEAAESDS